MTNLAAFGKSTQIAEIASLDMHEYILGANYTYCSWIIRVHTVLVCCVHRVPASSVECGNVISWLLHVSIR